MGDGPKSTQLPFIGEVVVEVCRPSHGGVYAYKRVPRSYKWAINTLKQALWLCRPKILKRESLTYDAPQQ